MSDERRDILFQEGFQAGAMWASQMARLSAERVRLLPRASDPEVFGERSRIAAGVVLDDLAAAIEEAIGKPPAVPSPSGVIPPAQRPRPITSVPAVVRPVGAFAHTAGEEDERSIAMAKGYTGDECRDCGNFTLIRSGMCLKCDTCGSTTGCS